MKIALPVNTSREVVTFKDYDSVDIFTFDGDLPTKVESLPKLTSLSMNALLIRALAKKGVGAVLARDMSEEMIAAFLKRGIKVKLGCTQNGKIEAISYIKENKS